MNIKVDKKHLAGLQLPGLGQCIRGKTMPRFQAVGHNRFVQILNIGDHWVCTTNVFSVDADDVYIFDSLQMPLNELMEVQVSSLLRDHVSADDHISYRLRHYDTQPTGTRLCGFYAVAAALSIAAGVDPTFFAFNEATLVDEVNERLASRHSKPISSTLNVHRHSDVWVKRKPKLHCLCRKPSSRFKMIECGTCSNWYHTACVSPPQEVVRRQSAEWNGPCCDLPKKAVIGQFDLTL